MVSRGPWRRRSSDGVPQADGRSPRGEEHASKGQPRSLGPERGISLAEPAAGRGYAWILLARPRIFQAERGVCVAERCISLSRPRTNETGWCARIAERCISLSRPRTNETGWCARIAERCISLSRPRTIRSRAIAIVIDGGLSHACTDTRTSRKRVSTTLSRILRAGRSASPRCTGISLARPHTSSPKGSPRQECRPPTERRTSVPRHGPPPQGCLTGRRFSASRDPAAPARTAR
jgi:hypothetical protein